MAQLGLQLLADAKETWESLKDIMGTNRDVTSTLT